MLRQLLTSLTIITLLAVAAPAGAVSFTGSDLITEIGQSFSYTVTGAPNASGAGTLVIEALGDYNWLGSALHPEESEYLGFNLDSVLSGSYLAPWAFLDSPVKGSNSGMWQTKDSWSHDFTLDGSKDGADDNDWFYFANDVVEVEAYYDWGQNILFRLEYSISEELLNEMLADGEFTLTILNSIGVDTEAEGKDGASYVSWTLTYPTVHNPEPGTLALAGAGLLLLVVFTRLRRRRNS